MAQDRHQAAQALSVPVETIAAVATPSGAGALGIVRIAGDTALPITLEMCEIKALEPRKATKVAVYDHDGQIDEGVAVYYPAAQSPVGEDLVELTLHGSGYILSRALSRALSRRARLALPGEFTQRAFLNGRLDLAQAEAVCALIGARSRSAHDAALRQLRGGLSEAVRRCRQPIFELLVRVEACLDHPEEDIPSLQAAEALSAIAAARVPVDALAASYGRGRRAAEGARLALVGRPNAGKSSLFNALLGRPRAIVRPEPGTTRDTIEETLELAGHAVTLIDTAGLREASDPAETEGVRRAGEALEGCDAAVLVVDSARGADGDDGSEHAKVLETARRRGVTLICALNKSDLGGAPAATPALAGTPAIRVSAATGAGLEELRASVAAGLALAPVEESVVVSARHHEALRRCSAELACAAAAVESCGAAWEDRAAFHLRQAARELGDVLGEDASDETLHAVFSRFCVGK